MVQGRGCHWSNVIHRHVQGIAIIDMMSLVVQYQVIGKILIGSNLCDVGDDFMWYWNDGEMVTFDDFTSVKTIEGVSSLGISCFQLMQELTTDSAHQISGGVRVSVVIQLYIISKFCAKVLLAS